jgi:PHD/YefM family antitoxin component YafN of YafNO toxin-antitoxin module
VIVRSVDMYMHIAIHINDMKVNALQVRQSFGSILKTLDKTGEPIVIEKNRHPVAVLISLKTFHERFIDLQEKGKRQLLMERFRKAASHADLDSLQVLREARYGSRD